MRNMIMTLFSNSCYFRNIYCLQIVQYLYNIRIKMISYFGLTQKYRRYEIFFARLYISRFYDDYGI